MGERRHPPNRLLAWERLQRGWSYEEITERVRAEMTRCGETDTGLTANTVRRWETGERWPDPRYRKHLVTIFGKPASDLGVLTPDELSARPDATIIEELRGLLDNPGGMDRASVLRGLLSAGALPFLAPLLSLDSEPTSMHAADPESYATIVRCHRRLYWSSPARPLYEAAYAHTQLGVGILRGADSGQRVRIADAVAASALLTARLAFFDLGQVAVADRCFDVALAATREAGDHALAAAVLGHMAFVPAFGQQPDRARTLLAAAFQHTWHGVSPAVRSWLHCVASEVEGRAGAGSPKPAPDRPGHRRDRRTTPTRPTGSTSTTPADCTPSPATPPSPPATHPGRRRPPHASPRRPRTRRGQAAQRRPRRPRLRPRRRRRPGRRLPQPGDLTALQADWYGTGFDRVRAVRPVLGDSHHGAQLDQQIAALAQRTALPVSVRLPVSLCLRTRSGSSASESSRNRQRLQIAGRRGCSPTGRA